MAQKTKQKYALFLYYTRALRSQSKYCIEMCLCLGRNNAKCFKIIRVIEMKLVYKFKETHLLQYC